MDCFVSLNVHMGKGQSRLTAWMYFEKLFEDLNMARNLLPSSKVFVSYTLCFRPFFDFSVF